MGRIAKEYACYRGDEFLVIGTLQEIAKYLGITYDSLRSSKSKGRLILIDLGSDKE